MNSKKYNIIKNFIVLISISIIGFFSFNSNVFAIDTSKIIFKSQYYGLEYVVQTKSDKNLSNLKEGDLEIILSGQINKIYFDAVNKPQLDQNNNNFYYSAPQIYGLLYEDGIGKYIDTLKFDRDYYNNKIIMPIDISLFLHKCPTIKHIKGLNNLDVSNTINFEDTFSQSFAEFIDISSWNLRSKGVKSLDIMLNNPEPKTIKLGVDTVFENADEEQLYGKMVNQETGFTYNAGTFFKDYDGTHPGTYKYVPND